MTVNPAPRLAGSRLLLVDDDEPWIHSLAEDLSLIEEFHCLVAATGGEALALIEKDEFDAVILDAELPDFDGREMCRLMRSAGLKVPIIMLGTSTRDRDVIRSLEAGADDYIAKPIRQPILLARLRAQLRQRVRRDDATLHIGPYVFRPAAQAIICLATGQKTHVTPAEAALLRYLYLAGNRTISRAAILAEVLRRDAGRRTHTVESLIYRLRQKIEHVPSSPEILVSEGDGYRLVP